VLAVKISCSGLEIRESAVGIRHADHVAPSNLQEIDTNFAGKWRTLGRYIKLADSGHGVLFSFSLPVLARVGKLF
jgi:hypothetical protein